MVVNMDIQYLTAFPQLGCQHLVRGTRLKPAGGMVVAIM
jgi:hypothetical protein